MILFIWFLLFQGFFVFSKGSCTNDGPPSSKELKKWRDEVEIEARPYRNAIKFVLVHSKRSFKHYAYNNGLYNCVSHIQWRLYKLDNSDGSTNPAGSDDIEMRYFNDIDIKRGISDCQNYTLEVELIPFQGKKGTGDWFQIKKVNTTSLPDQYQYSQTQKIDIGPTWVKLESSGGDGNCIVTHYKFQCNNLDPIFIQSTPNHHYEVMNLVPNTDYYHCHTEFIYRVQNISSYSYGKMEKFTTSKVEYQVSDITSTSVTINLDEGIIDYLNYHLSYLCVSQWDKKRVISLNDQVTKIIDLMPYRKYKFCLQVTPIQQDDQQRLESCYYRMTQEDRPSTPPVVKSINDVTHNGFIIHWDKPDESNGIIVQYDMTIYSRCKYDYSSFCKMESCSNWTNANDSGDEVKSFSSDTNEYNFFRLSPYTEYQVNISAYTSAGQGPWSQQEIVLTRPSLKDTTFNFEMFFHMESIEIAIDPTCPYVGPLLFQIYVEGVVVATKNIVFSIERNQLNLNTTIDKGLKKGKTYRVCMNVRFNNADVACDSDIFGNCKIPEPICKTGRTLEDIPDDPPRVYNSRQTLDLTKNSFKVIWQPPKEPNGIITNYQLEVRGRCHDFHKKICPKDANCLHFILVREKTVSGLVSYLSFYDLSPHWIYEVRIRAINSIGPSDWSLWEHCQIKTLSTVLLDEYNFTTASTSSEISMVVLPYCPFTGPLKYTVKFNEAGKNTLTEYFEYTPPFMSELSSSFNAKPGKNYTICLSVEVKIDDFVKCKTDCSSIKSICKNVAATCSNIPQTTETPIQIEDQSDYSCNPFTNAVINIEKMTFDGSGNSIQKIKIINTDDNSMVYEMDSIVWDLDTIIVIENLLHNSTITLIVEAIGCNNTVFTPKFKIRTQSIQIPTVEQIIEEELESLKGSKEGNVLVEKMNLVKNSGIFLIRENKINIQYGEVEYYTIGNTTWSSNRLFKINKFNNELRPGEDCYKPVIDKDGISCYIGASIQGDNVNDISDEIAVHVQSNISGELQNYSSIIKIKRDFIDYSTVISVLVTLLSIGFVVILVVVGLRFKNNFIGISKKRNTATSSMVRLNKGPSHSIQISEFVKKLEERKIDFKEEFQELDKCETLMITLNKTTDQAILNNELNRYANILPYDDSRVVLDGLPGYINANWIKTPINSGVSYIATQGPTKNTIDHFWKMVYSYKVRIIVVLTKLVEKTINVEDKSINSVIKCEQYWPKQGKKTYGVFTVELIEEHGSPNLPQLIERRLKVTNTETRSSHTVLQLQYIGWPDHGAPTSPKKLLALHSVLETRKIDMNDGSEKMVIIVHCSAGVGRTGTLLALDSISKEIDEGNTEIDVMKTVFELRMNRCKMVQQSIQYKYLYYCIGAYIKENVHTVRDPSTYQDEIEVQYMYPGN
ncbi:uncharacterized protein [Lepeophtheirus salmonis]|uniref:uncharacterized protein n=1 Tax=Lepeophtheirus salmonis TaxID=72036 RepID=UPI001AE45425|nr:uncharacterized protein LOC121117420 [Lepeophtheirus salmonis]